MEETEGQRYKIRKIRKVCEKETRESIEVNKQNMVGRISVRRFKNKLSANFQKCLQIFYIRLNTILSLTDII